MFVDLSSVGVDGIFIHILTTGGALHCHVEHHVRDKKNYFF